MTLPSERALLPAGLADGLPPAAEFEARTVGSIIDVFGGYGFERVKPPLIEFEESLLAGSGNAAAAHTFRLMDPVSQKMLAIRPDVTLQVARIAATRLGNSPRPLRLSYAGEVLRVKGTQLRPERQFGQVGAELIGSQATEADAELISMAAEALTLQGVANLSVDLGLPTLVPTLCDNLNLDQETQTALRDALDRKDAASVAAIGGDAADIMGQLMSIAGPAQTALAALAALDLPAPAAAERQSLLDLCDLLADWAPELTLTVDPVENRGFEYHTGVTYTFFALNVRGELGRGGRYRVDSGTETGEEAASGVTLFMDSVLRALPAPQRQEQIFLPYGTTPAQAAKLRADGRRCLLGLTPGNDLRALAKLAGCTHYFENGTVVALD